MGQDWVRVAFLSPSHSAPFSPLSLLWSDHYRGLADLFLHLCLFFLSAASLLHFQQPNFSLRLREPLGPSQCDTEVASRQVHLWGLLRMCVIPSMLWSKQHSRMIYTSKEEGGIALSVFSESTSLPVWTGWLKRADWWQTHIPLQFHMAFSHVTTVLWISMIGFDWPMSHDILFFSSDLMIYLLLHLNPIDSTSSGPVTQNWLFELYKVTINTYFL